MNFFATPRWMLFPVLLLLPLSAGAADPGGGVLGDFLTQAKAVVRVHPCGSSVCLMLVQLPPNPPSTLDGHNPDETLRGRALCGVDIGTGFRRQDDDHLVDGAVYDPVSGKTYKATATAEGDKLKLHGYVGISLFGRTETWTRVPAVEGCK